MKPTPTKTCSALAFAAHPDDLEFACGAVIAGETRAGRKVHFVICSRGESGSYGTPAIRTAEAKKAAKILGASLEFIRLDGDAHLEVRAAHAVKLAGLIRQHQPEIVLAPSLAQNQHPDHYRLGKLTRDAARLARFGGIKELRGQPAHAISQLYYYAVTPDAEPRDLASIIIDVSAPEVMEAWMAAMAAHPSQVRALKYVELQLARARVLGLRSGVEHAIALYANDPPVVNSLAPVARGARRF